ncbi:MAG TPA: hypothetical protein VHZ76_08060 [Gammaproteobacteria bacterium]|jgi:hypothetical protein|nr:hypothetical protein [Gammaproteobacteria bacterium]
MTPEEKKDFLEQQLKAISDKITEGRAAGGSQKARAVYLTEWLDDESKRERFSNYLVHLRSITPPDQDMQHGETIGNFIAGESKTFKELQTSLNNIGIVDNDEGIKALLVSSQYENMLSNEHLLNSLPPELSALLKNEEEQRKKLFAGEEKRNIKTDLIVTLGNHPNGTLNLQGDLEAVSTAPDYNQFKAALRVISPALERDDIAAGMWAGKLYDQVHAELVPEKDARLAQLLDRDNFIAAAVANDLKDKTKVDELIDRLRNPSAHSDAVIQEAMTKLGMNTNPAVVTDFNAEVKYDEILERLTRDKDTDPKQAMIYQQFAGETVPPDADPRKDSIEAENRVKKERIINAFKNKTAAEIDRLVEDLASSNLTDMQTARRELNLDPLPLDVAKSRFAENNFNRILKEASLAPQLKKLLEANSDAVIAAITEMDDEEQVNQAVKKVKCIHNETIELVAAMDKLGLVDHTNPDNAALFVKREQTDGITDKDELKRIAKVNEEIEANKKAPAERIGKQLRAENYIFIEMARKTPTQRTAIVRNMYTKSLALRGEEAKQMAPAEKKRFIDDVAKRTEELNRYLYNIEDRIESAKRIGRQDYVEKFEREKAGIEELLETMQKVHANIARATGPLTRYDYFGDEGRTFNESKKDGEDGKDAFDEYLKKYNIITSDVLSAGVRVVSSASPDKSTEKIGGNVTVRVIRSSFELPNHQTIHTLALQRHPEINGRRGLDHQFKFSRDETNNDPYHQHRLPTQKGGLPNDIILAWANNNVPNIKIANPEPKSSLEIYGQFPSREHVVALYLEFMDKGYNFRQLKNISNFRDITEKEILGHQKNLEAVKRKSPQVFFKDEPNPQGMETSDKKAQELITKWQSSLDKRHNKIEVDPNSIVIGSKYRTPKPGSSF